MRRLLVVALTPLALAVPSITVWRVMVDTQAGRPSNSALSVEFKPQRGDLAA